MPEENELDNNPKVKISNIENILPKIEEKLSGREQEQAEYENIKTRMSALKKDYEDTDEKYIEIKREINQLNKRAVKLYLRIEPSPFVRFWKKIQQMWRTSKTLSFIQLTLIAMLIAIAAYHGNNYLQTLSIGLGFALILIIAFVRLPKYRFFTGFSIFAMGLFIYSNYSPESLRWTLMSLGITLIALGIAFHTFRAGESLEQRIGRIEVMDKKLDEILKRMPALPSEDGSQ